MTKSTRTVQGAGGLARHLEGWQPGLLAVFLAGSVALLAVPRSVPPTEVPVPFADPRRLGEVAAADDARARAAQDPPLDVDVRALGSLVRAFGRADATDDQDALASVRVQIGPAAAAARAQGEEALLGLRAFQLRAFVRAVRTWEATGEERQDLVELGGPFTRMVRKNGWCEGSPTCVLRMDEAALRASFKRRWNEVTGLSGGRLELSLEEARALYGFLLEHPITGRSGSAPETFLMRKIDELAAIDPAYPRDLARGVVLYRMGDYRRAAGAFGAHLEVAPDGPFALRAQNHLRAALERAASEP